MSIGSPPARQANPAREEQIDGPRLSQLEELRVLEEERALLGKEQREPRQVDLLLVGLDLREVGVDRDIERQVGAHAPLDVETHVAGSTTVSVRERRVVGHRA